MLIAAELCYMQTILFSSCLFHAFFFTDHVLSPVIPTAYGTASRTDVWLPHSQPLENKRDLCQRSEWILTLYVLVEYLDSAITTLNCPFLLIFSSISLSSKVLIVTWVTINISSFFLPFSAVNNRIFILELSNVCIIIIMMILAWSWYL